MAKGKGKKAGAGHFKEDLLKALNTVVAYALLVIVALYFATDYVMMPDAQYAYLLEQYLRLTPDLAVYMHYQLTVPFCVFMVIFLLSNRRK